MTRLVKDSGSAPFGGVVLRQERRVLDGLELQAVSDEDEDIATFDGSLRSPPARPLLDRGRLVARDVDGGRGSQLSLLNGAQVHLPVGKPAGEFRPLGAKTLRVSTHYEQAASPPDVLAVARVLGPPGASSSGAPQAAARAPAAGARRGRWSSLNLAGPGRDSRLRPRRS